MTNIGASNALLRQYFPKGTDLRVHSAEQLAAVAVELNERPGAVLGLLAPREALEQLLTGNVASTTWDRRAGRL